MARERLLVRKIEYQNHVPGYSVETAICFWLCLVIRFCLSLSGRALSSLQCSGSIDESVAEFPPPAHFRPQKTPTDSAGTTPGTPTAAVTATSQFPSSQVPKFPSFQRVLLLRFSRTSSPSASCSHSLSLAFSLTHLQRPVPALDPFRLVSTTRSPRP